MDNLSDARKKFYDKHLEVLKREMSAQSIHAWKFRVECKAQWLENNSCLILIDEDVIKYEVLCINEYSNIYLATSFIDPETVQFCVKSFTKTTTGASLLVSLIQKSDKTFNGTVYLGIPPATRQYQKMIFGLKRFMLNNFENHARYPEELQKILLFENMDPGQFQKKYVTQNEAVLEGLQNPFSVVVGPPGTGKTFVMVEIVRRSIPDKTILILTEKNVHADNLLMKLLMEFEETNAVLRLNSNIHRAHIRDTVLYNFDIENVIENLLFEDQSCFEHFTVFKYFTLQEMKKILLTKLNSNERMSNFIFNSCTKKVDKIIKNINVVIKELVKEYTYKRHPIIVGTVGTVVSSLDNSLQFDMVLIDEAGSISQQNCFLAADLINPNGKFLLFGDSRQNRK
jgi:hypothetical protein